MSGQNSTALFRFLSFFKNWLQRKPRQQPQSVRPPQIDQIYFQGKNYPPEKQAEIEDPCNLLFRQKQAITSGRLQLIGLGKIKKSMGSAWEWLQSLVHDITEQAIKEHVASDDIFIRYKDDTYVIIFSQASYEEGEQKSTVIVDAIRRRLVATNNENLRNIEIQKDVVVFKTDVLADKPLTEALDMMFTVFKTKVLTETDEHAAALPADEEEGTAEEAQEEMSSAFWAQVERMECSYMPLWDARKKLVTSYLLLPKDASARKEVFGMAQTPYSETTDLSMLKTLQMEAKKNSSTGKQAMIICPVRHETLYNREYFKKYDLLCQNIPHKQRKHLIFLITNLLPNMPTTNTCWFVPALKKYCAQVFAEIPAGQTADFAALRNAGIDALGVHGNISAIEQENILHLKNFSTLAKAARTPEIFALDIGTLSLASFAVAAGFHYLGGSALHGEAEKPEVKYLPEDLLAKYNQ